MPSLRESDDLGGGYSRWPDVDFNNDDGYLAISDRSEIGWKTLQVYLESDRK